MKSATTTMTATTALLLLAPSFLYAQATGIVTETVDETCYATTFEGAVNFAEIGAIAGTPIDFGDNWVGLIDPIVENNPSGVTVALGVGEDNMVLFSEPVASVSFFYSSISDVTLTAFDIDGNPVGTAGGLANAVTGFNVWDLIGVDAGENIIVGITVGGSPAGLGIDDFEACAFNEEPPDPVGPVDLLMMLIDDLDQLVASGLPKKQRRNVQKAIDRLCDAVCALEESPPNVLKALNKIRSAVKELTTAIRRGLDPLLVTDVLDELVGLVRQFAVDAIDAAIESGLPKKQIRTAMRFLDKGDVHWVCEQFVAAVDDFRNAFKSAQPKKKKKKKKKKDDDDDDD